MSRQGELKREFGREGCRKIREDKKHEKLYSPITGETFQMGRHDNEELPKGTEQN